MAWGWGMVMRLPILACFLATSTASAIHGGTTRVQHLNKTTSFLKVIPTDDLKTSDAIYMTPAVLVIGRRNGDIVRCLQENLNECEVFFRSGHWVRSFIVTGEYMYVGLDGGQILRCELNVRDSCRTFHVLDHDVHALVIAGGYLFAAPYSGTIYRCDLSLPGSCRKLYTPGDHVYSLMLFKGYIYAGLSNGNMIRYSTRADDGYTNVYRMTTGIYGLSNMGDSFIAMRFDGGLWKCSLKLDARVSCAVLSANHYTVPNSIAQFSGMLYVLSEEGLRGCHRENSSYCINYEHHKLSWGMANVYATYNMQSRYKNEDTACIWQSNAKCPPFVTYYDVQERYMLEVHVVDGKLFNAQGFLVDTTNADEGHNGSAAIFAMGPDGRILLSNSHRRELLHTSSLFAGGPVSGAGEMVVKDGVIVKINACSEHYRLDANMNRQVIESLLAQGYTHHIDSSPCDDASLCSTRAPHETRSVGSVAWGF